MFYKMILRARDLWYASNECTVLNIVNYMETRGFLRDAQIDAVKTYLYLKIACGCKPLAHLFMNGSFNTLSLENEPLTTATREYLTNNPAAAALYQYASEKDEKGQVTAKALAEKIKAKPQTIDYKKFFEDVFYNVTYTDYLFSLPMGAGKTYLMAAFIYLDLYFAHNEPDNPAFAHNFMLFAPSGLKSSVVPSLRTIQNFDPSWVLPEPAASEIKRLIQFEILDENKTAKKSNRIKNPNVQKLASHQPYQDLFGLVAVTNAEKVILDKLIIGKDGQISFLDDKEDAVHFANELRSTIGEIPSLAIFIDEVHHAVLDDIRLRHVVNEWASRGHLNSVLGFSGTPYLSSPQKIKIDDLIVSSSEISNIVYYYPLIDGIGNFLKRPIVKIAEIADSSEIIRLDAVHPVLHGKNGEDGTIQGLFQLAGIPFVGCDHLSSAVCMDKAFTNMTADVAGIRQAKWRSINAYEYQKNADAFLAEAVDYLKFPIFVKPANAGSSVGISKAKDMPGLKEAMQIAFGNRLRAPWAKFCPKVSFMTTKQSMLPALPALPFPHKILMKIKWTKCVRMLSKHLKHSVVRGSLV